jgi:hypothetical protein
MESKENIFEKNFSKYMKSKDIESFKKHYPTLYGVIMLSMDDYGVLKMLSLMANHGMSITLLNNKIAELEDELRSSNT